MMRVLRRAERSWLALALMTLTACEADPAAPVFRPDSPGEPVTEPSAVLEGSPLAWSPDGSQLFFLGADGALRAVGVTGEARVVSAGVVDGLTPTSLDLSADGRWVFLALLVPSDGWAHWETMRRLYRFPASSGAGELLSDAVTAAMLVRPSPPVPSPQGEEVAYPVAGDLVESTALTDPLGTRDTLVIHDLAGGQRAAVAFGAPLAFSPDGSRLAFAALPCHDRAWVPNPCTLHVLDRTTSAVQDLEWRQWETRFSVWWSGAGLHTLSYGTDARVSSSSGWLLRNESTGAARLIDAWPSNAAVAVSGDGTRLGAWVADAGGRFELRIVDLSADTAVVAAARPPGLPGPPALTRDGRRVAYVVDGALYVKDLPASW